MARLEYEAVDGLLSVMMNKDEKLAARIEKALTLAGEAAQEQLRKEAKSFKSNRGVLAGMVKPGKPTRGNGAAWIEVWAQGDNYRGSRSKKDERAETVAFVLEYGRTNMEPNPWHKRANRRSRKRISSIIAEVMGNDA